jgi:hypothetical protein
LLDVDMRNDRGEAVATGEATVEFPPDAKVPRKLAALDEHGCEDTTMAGALFRIRVLDLSCVLEDFYLRNSF